MSTDAYAEILPDFTDAPFLAVAQDNQTEIGLANPGAAHFAFELLAANGSVVDWFVAPRHGTLFGKLLNSGAARRSLYPVATAANCQSLNATNLWVRFNRRSDTLSGLALLNPAHWGISFLNLVNDFSSVGKTLEEIAKREEALTLLGSCGGLDAAKAARFVLAGSGLGYDDI